LAFSADFVNLKDLTPFFSDLNKSKIASEFGLKAVRFEERRVKEWGQA
jgi:hypothetical protein